MCVMAAKDGVLVRRRLRIFAAAVALVLLCAVCVGGVSGATWKDHVGDTSWGSDYDTNSEGVFYIETAKELAKFATMVNGGNDFFGKTIYLRKDIDLSGHRWVAIGLSGFPNYPFKGTFDGKGHTISNLTQFIVQYEEGGLFGHVSGGTIKNVTLENVDITIGKSIGGVAGASGATVGSLVGILNGGSVTGCTISNVNIVPVEIAEGWSGGSGSNIFTVGDVVGTVTGGGDVSDISSDNIAVPVDEFTKYAAAISNNDQTVKFIYNNNRYEDGVETNIAPYTVHIYMMDGNGEYPAAPTLAIEFSGAIGAAIDITTKYPAPEGYVIDSAKSTLSGTVTADGKLVLYVYYALSTQTSVTYMITIPDIVISEDTKTGSTVVSVSGLSMPDNSVLKVRVLGDFQLEHQTAAEATVAYELRNGASELLADGALVGQFTLSSQSPLPLTAKVTGTAPYAGTYTDLLTFEYWVEEAV